MLSGTFYQIGTILNTAGEGGQMHYSGFLTLDPSHPLYQGHFPGNPVVPGVCQVQMVRELAEEAMSTPLRMTASDQIKFMAVINPDEQSRLDFSLVIKPSGHDRFTIQASLFSGDRQFLKMRGTFEKAPAWQQK